MPFQKDYAKYYDLFYSEKDYEKECGYIIKTLEKYSNRRIVKILDIACGTGLHAFNLAKANLKVTAGDFSSDMLKIAKTKKVSDDNPTYIRNDMRYPRKFGKFDAVICMFAALNYLSSYQELEKVLRNVANNLKTNGLFFCDVWNGLAVINKKPSNRIKRVKKPNISITRSAESTLDSVAQVCRVNYKLTILKKGSSVPIQYKEVHNIRFYFPQEIRYIFKKNGFDVLDMHPFLEPKKQLSDNDWNMTVIAKKTKIKS